ncbi:hypothetical protein J2T19_000187 [Paenibacillus tundrae]|uniref:Transposase n=1 Tax=Paenibacillus tundrae TaxID=528187 RepID=A0ABT9W7B8_9BACL|nr:hypothetical protein [Paenibacillus tundrae]
MWAIANSRRLNPNFAKDLTQITRLVGVLALPVPAHP